MSKPAKHTIHVHTCKCGLTVKGNAYYQHLKSCSVYAAWKFSQDTKAEAFREKMRKASYGE